MAAPLQMDTVAKALVTAIHSYLIFKFESL